MKRREFLTLALGAGFVLPITKQAFDRTAAVEKINAGLREVAFLYWQDSKEGRETTIKEVEQLIEKFKSTEAKKCFEEYRDFLLSINDIPAEVWI